MKSPPELWAELSELETLARHLGEFGEIRITKVDPESRVEWEADRASGTVRLEPSGWGTRVVLTVDTPEVPREAPVAEPEPEAVAPEPEPVAHEPEPVHVEPAEPEPEPVKRGWFARLFRRPPEPARVEPRVTEGPVTEGPDTSPAAADAAPGDLPTMEPAAREPLDMEPVEPYRAEARPVPPERAFGTIEWETPAEPVAEEPEPEPLAPDEAHAVLTGVLDTLGAAHHRPFSRP